MWPQEEETKRKAVVVKKVYTGPLVKLLSRRIVAEGAPAPGPQPAAVAAGWGAAPSSAGPGGQGGAATAPAPGGAAAGGAVEGKAKEEASVADMEVERGAGPDRSTAAASTSYTELVGATGACLWLTSTP